MSRLTKARAAALAMKMAVACMLSAEADGFQEFEGEEFYEQDSRLLSHSDNYFVIQVGEHTVTFKMHKITGKVPS